MNQETRLLTPLKVAVRQRLTREMSVQLDIMPDFVDVLADQLVMELRAEIYGHQEAAGTTETSRRIPATWFDWWLRDTRLGRLMARWRPVRTRVETVSVPWSSTVAFPEWARNVPAQYGQPAMIHLSGQAYWGEDLEP